MHQIVITNLTDKEILHYPVVIIKGYIQTSTTSKCSVQEDITLLSSNRTTKSKLHLSYWKFVHELQPNENDLQVKFCCTSKKLRLTYHPTEIIFSVIPVYIICADHNGNFQAPRTMENSPDNARLRINVCAKLLQSLLAEKLYEQMSVRRTFSLEECVVFSSNICFNDARKMSQDALWEYFAEEIMSSSIASPRRKYLGFLSFTTYDGNKYNSELKKYQDWLGITEGHAALGGGGLALFGTGCLYTWPKAVEEVVDCFEDKLPIDRKSFLDDSCYRGTKGACFATTLGSVLHELCHTFDVGHTNDGIMGRGFDHINKVFTIEGCTLLAKKTLRDIKSDLFDDTYFAQSTAAVLFFHRWFTQKATSNTSFDIQYDSKNNLIRSRTGLRVIEIRKPISEMVVENWVFLKKVLKFQFQIPETVTFNYRDKNMILVVIDNDGNIFKETIVL